LPREGVIESNPHGLDGLATHCAKRKGVTHFLAPGKRGWPPTSPSLQVTRELNRKIVLLIGTCGFAPIGERISDYPAIRYDEVAIGSNGINAAR